MKKWIATLLALVLVGTLGMAAAEEAVSKVTASGVVAAVNSYDITAPFQGTLLPYDLEAGDTVKAGDVLFEMDTTKIYATFDGVSTAVFASVGDDAAAVSGYYGTLCSIEPTNQFYVQATTKGAYNDEDNKRLHVGEKLYLKSTKNSTKIGEGRVIAVTDTGYRVEITKGAFNLKQTIKLYREEGFTSKSCVGQGVVGRFDPITITGSGRVLAVYCREGWAVRKGSLLFELIDTNASPDVTSPQITAPASGVLGSIGTAGGQSVGRNQVITKIYDTSALEVQADVDEIDLSRIRVGDSLAVELDAFPDDKLQGTVTSISSLGTEKQNASYYTVKLSIPARDNVKIGMSATVYIP